SPLPSLLPPSFPSSAVQVEDPDGYHVHSSQGQTDGVFSFESMREGDYKVCFTNKSPINEEIVFELHVGHHFSEKELAKEGVLCGAVQWSAVGDYKVCFTNKSPINEEIFFELHVGHHFSEKELAKEEHVEQTRDKAANLYERVMVLSMQAKFRHSQAQRLNELAKTTTARLIFKTAVQSGALILCCSIQVYLLHRLFERKLGRSFV
ncbi:unnamed protein product, partial [Closterium sp. NIES-54]